MAPPAASSRCRRSNEGAPLPGPRASRAPAGRPAAHSGPRKDAPTAGRYRRQHLLGWSRRGRRVDAGGAAEAATRVAAGPRHGRDKAAADATPAQGNHVDVTVTPSCDQKGVGGQLSRGTGTSDGLMHTAATRPQSRSDRERKRMWQRRHQPRTTRPRHPRA